MKKAYKRILILVALMTGLMMSFPMGVFAAEPLKEDMTSKLTLNYQNSGSGVSGAQFDIYKVADRTDYSKFKVVEPFSEYPVNYNFSEMDAEGWASLAKTLEGQVLQNNVTAMESGKTDADGKLSFSSDLKPGLYLVVGHKITISKKIYEPSSFIIALPEQKDGKWNRNVTADVKGTTSNTRGGGGGGGGGSVTENLNVLKVWNDKGYENKRTESVDVVLYKDGKVVETVTLNEGNNWKHTWKDLSTENKWVVMEKDVPEGYTVSVSEEGKTICITNSYDAPNEDPPGDNPPGDNPPEDNPPADNPPKDNPPADNPKNPDKNTNPGSSSSTTKKKLPQTGMLWWPVLALGAAGAVAGVTGVAIKRKDKNDK